MQIFHIYPSNRVVDAFSNCHKRKDIIIHDYSGLYFWTLSTALCILKEYLKFMNVFTSKNLRSVDLFNTIPLFKKSSMELLPERPIARMLSRLVGNSPIYIKISITVFVPGRMWTDIPVHLLT